MTRLVTVSVMTAQEALPPLVGRLRFLFTKILQSLQQRPVVMTASMAAAAAMLADVSISDD